jgi:hypothetical protein
MLEYWKTNYGITGEGGYEENFKYLWLAFTPSILIFHPFNIPMTDAYA